MQTILTHLKLSQYKDKFLKEGIDNLETLGDYEDEDLIKYLKMTKPHIKRLRRHIETLHNSSVISHPDWYIQLHNDQDLWNDELLEADIPVLTHEYIRVKDLLSSGQYFGVLLQIKDLFEILLKLPLLLVMNDAFNNKKLQKDSDFFLLALEKPLSLGSWQDLAHKIQKNDFKENKFIPLIRNILKLYNKYNIVKWRNDQIGHGALMLEDDISFQEDIKSKLLILKNFFQENISSFESIKFDKRNALISYQNSYISCSPFFYILDEKIFFFDSYLSQKKKTHSLNYCFGKKCVNETPLFEDYLKHRFHESKTTLLNEKEIDRVRYASDDESFDLLEKSTDFIEPTAIKKWLQTSINSIKKGKFLLQMERGTGKTLFCKALDQLALNKIDLELDILTRAYYINDIFRHSLENFSSEISHFILNKKVENGNFCDVFKGTLPSLSSDSNKQDLAYCLNWYKMQYGVEKLLIIIDAVDEIPLSNEKSIFDIIPDNEMLDEGVYILITSRTKSEITNYTQKKLYTIEFDKECSVHKKSIENITTLKQYIKKYKISENEVAIELLIQKADYRILYLNMLKEIILAFKINLEDIPENEDIIDFYLNNIKSRYGEKYFQTLFYFLLILASLKEELPLRELAALNYDAKINHRLLANLFDLRGFVKKTRSEKGNLFSLNHILLTKYFMKHYFEELQAYITQLYRDISLFSTQDNADIYKLAYLREYESDYKLSLSSELKSSFVLKFLLEIEQSTSPRVLLISTLLLEILLKEKNQSNLINSISKLNKGLINQVLKLHIKKHDFLLFIEKNIDTLLKNYTIEQYQFFKALYINHYQYKNKKIAFKIVSYLMQKEENFEDILNYISMCKGNARPLEAMQIIQKYLKKNNFLNLQAAQFYYIVGRSYVDNIDYYEQSKTYLDKSIQLYKVNNNTYNIKAVTNTLANYYFYKADFKQAYKLLAPIYTQAIKDTENIFTSNALEAIYSNMEVHNLVCDKPKNQEKIHSLTSWFNLYHNNTLAIRKIKENDNKSAVKILNECLDIAYKKDEYYMQAVLLYNLFLLQNDSKMLADSKKICTQKGYNMGLYMIENIGMDTHVIHTYKINKKAYWLCAKHIDLLL